MVPSAGVIPDYIENLSSLAPIYIQYCIYKPIVVTEGPLDTFLLLIVLQLDFKNLGGFAFGIFMILIRLVLNMH